MAKFRVISTVDKQGLNPNWKSELAEPGDIVELDDISKIEKYVGNGTLEPIDDDAIGAEIVEPIDAPASGGVITPPAADKGDVVTNTAATDSDKDKDKDKEKVEA